MEDMVITGMGLVTALGPDPAQCWEALVSGKTGVRKNGSGVAPYTAPVDVTLPEDGYDRSIGLALACTGAALADSGKSFPLDRETGVFISSTKGGMHSLGSVSAGAMANLLADGPARTAAAVFGIQGPVYNIVAACATTIFALSAAMRAVKRGECRRAIIGAAESALTPLILSGFHSMGILTRQGPRPFKKGRDGFAPAEGAAVFTLEKRADAEQRGAKIYGRVCGTATVTENENFVRFEKSGRAIGSAIRKALDQPGLAPGRIDAVCVHGTGTQNNDLCETNGITGALGECGYHVPCFGVKPALGHVLGASAAVELAVSLYALNTGVLPPTLGRGEPDPGCALNISDQARKHEMHTVLSLNFGFGGHVGAVIIGKA
jgi:3-oxoacyl-[acyl-carrier-protein] synthase II